jgi:hypothetical protein
MSFTGTQFSAESDFFFEFHGGNAPPMSTASHGSAGVCWAARGIAVAVTPVGVPAGAT